ncbi:unnamed protein product [Symbiodinium natans]|uniref:Uncharacterized protein n=1 Tax=Symbiodinium natans TaxID=878477 RepID=A0A812UQL4_9DINO|nr:unnamed protein product [Symbiodinium natans]
MGAGSSVASQGKREASHHFSFGANIVIFTSVLWRIAAETPESARSCLRRWGPFILATFGCCLVMWDSFRHILLDHGGVLFPEEVLAMYRDDGGLTTMGHISQFTTITGPWSHIQCRVSGR